MTVRDPAFRHGLSLLSQVGEGPQKLCCSVLPQLVPGQLSPLVLPPSCISNPPLHVLSTVLSVNVSLLGGNVALIGDELLIDEHGSKCPVSWLICTPNSSAAQGTMFRWFAESYSG